MITMLNLATKPTADSKSAFLGLCCRHEGL